MCARFTLTASAHQVAQLFDLELLADIDPRFNVAPTQNVLAVRLNDEKQKEFAWLRWGLVPSWADDLKIGQRLINARSETVGEKPAFRDAIRKRRCLIAADGFYEWKGEKGHKQPYFIHRPGREPFAFAGVWEHWHDESGRLIETCSILTTESNGVIRPLHDRMPVILPPSAWGVWLDPSVRDVTLLSSLLVPAPEEALELRDVSRAVNDVRNNGPELLDTVT